MLRRLMLMLLAVGLGLVASSMLRGERPPAGVAQPPERPVGDAVCGAPTRSGGRCRRRPEPGSERCWQHR
jgi:hypothetical protein